MKSNNICNKCSKGKLLCNHTYRLKRDNQHYLEHSKVSSWECNKCGAYFKLYTPISELIEAEKRKTKKRKSIEVI